MMVMKQGHRPKRREKFGMVRNNELFMYQEQPEFLLCSYTQELCAALQCPEMMHGRKGTHRGE